MIILFSLKSHFNGLGIHIFFDLIEVRLHHTSCALLVCSLYCPRTVAIRLFDAEIYLLQVGINLVESNVCLSQLLDDIQVIRAHLNIIVKKELVEVGTPAAHKGSLT